MSTGIALHSSTSNFEVWKVGKSIAAVKEHPLATASSE